MGQELRPNDHPWLQHYHLMPAKGWLNDPNGAVQFNGIYHIYHQYIPGQARGGAPSHWGHFTSPDLVTFTQQENFLAPDQPFDKDGAYSGSALVVDGRIHYFYTGNVRDEGYHDYTFSGRQQNVIHMTSKDGHHIEKRQVVIDAKDFPQGYTNHIRDPKVFQVADHFYMLLGARSIDNLGSILLYRSENLEDWHYRGVFLQGTEGQGFMWECPDYFHQEGQDVLLFSPQGVLGTLDTYQNQYSSGYYLGHVDWKKETFLPDTPFQELDYGFDFYAPQSFTDDAGRQILWAWMGVPDHEPDYVNPTVAYGWQHCLTMPRQLLVRKGHLYQQPLEEYQKLRQGHQKFHGVKEISEGVLEGEIFELLIQGDLDTFDLKLRQDTHVTYDGQRLCLSHGPSGYGRRRRYLRVDQVNRLQIFSDRSSLEIFVNFGQYTLSTRVYPNVSKQSVTLTNKHAVDVDFWHLSHDKEK